jgi:hypothetical protein
MRSGDYMIAEILKFQENDVYEIDLGTKGAVRK